MATPSTKILAGANVSGDDIRKAFSRRPKKKTPKKGEKLMLGPGIEVPQEFLAAQELLAQKLMGGGHAGVRKRGEPAGRENISSIHVGQKMVDGLPTGSLAVIVWVRKKLDDEKIHAKFRIPKKINVNGVQVPVDVQVGTEVHPHAIGGGVCGLNKPPHARGSIGCFVFVQLPSGRIPFLLTNNHVIGAFLLANDDDDVFEFAGFSGPVGANIAGTILKMGTASDAVGESVDAAMALAVVNPVPDINQHVGLRFSENIVQISSFGVNVEMFGAKSGARTTGRVVNIHTFLDVPYTNFPVGRSFTIRRVLEIAPTSGSTFSQEGDSGSLVITDSGDPTAILIGGPPPGSAGNSFAQDLATIQTDLRFDGIFSVP
ncbi:MAG: hypothetical protein HY289_06300 [Planctomycetes bacterium]|nr:hypothetical protein [Planctomycetota bacterium]